MKICDVQFELELQENPDAVKYKGDNVLFVENT